MYIYFEQQLLKRIDLKFSCGEFSSQINNLENSFGLNYLWWHYKVNKKMFKFIISDYSQLESIQLLLRSMHSYEFAITTFVCQNQFKFYECPSVIVQTYGRWFLWKQLNLPLIVILNSIRTHRSYGSLSWIESDYMSHYLKTVSELDHETSWITRTIKPIF